MQPFCLTIQSASASHVIEAYSHISYIRVMRRPCVRQYLLSAFRVSLPYFDAMVCRCCKDARAGEVDVEYSDAICMTRVELLSLGHDQRMP